MSTALRPTITPMPPRIQMLDTFRGYPVPWFVEILPNGEPEFRAADGRKWRRAIRERLCWVCGQKLGANLVFVLGPMCGITRATSEPPVHLDCAVWSARNCPFLTKPHMIRRMDNLPEEIEAPPGEPIDRNPGVTLLWTTKSYSLFAVDDGRHLIRVGDPEAITCWAEGRTATEKEILESITGGFPRLMEAAEVQGPKAIEALLDRKREFLVLLSEVGGYAE